MPLKSDDQYRRQQNIRIAALAQRAPLDADDRPCRKFRDEMGPPWGFAALGERYYRGGNRYCAQPGRCGNHVQERH